MLDLQSVQALINAYKDDAEALELIRGILASFEDYHHAIFEEQTFPLLFSGSDMDGSTFREQRAATDRKRTAAHNAVIANVRILNRMAAQAGLNPTYEGIISEDRPYRREVADAVLSYVESVIKNRH